jgi:hypothetical protein
MQRTAGIHTARDEAQQDRGRAASLYLNKQKAHA